MAEVLYEDTIEADTPSCGVVLKFCIKAGKVLLGGGRGGLGRRKGAEPSSKGESDVKPW